MTGDALQQRQQIAVGQAAQPDALDAAVAVQGRQQFGDRMAGCDVGVAEHSEHADSHRLLEGDDMAQQLHARSIRPMEIIEDDQYRIRRPRRVQAGR